MHITSAHLYAWHVLVKANASDELRSSQVIELDHLKNVSSPDFSWLICRDIEYF